MALAGPAAGRGWGLRRNPVRRCRCCSIPVAVLGRRRSAREEGIAGIEGVRLGPAFLLASYHNIVGGFGVPVKVRHYCAL
jgi:hypothetical protein